MEMPKFKPTKWKLESCLECSKNYFDSWKKMPSDCYRGYGCDHLKHTIIHKDNIPFFVPDMRIDGFGYKGWVRLVSEATGRGYDLGPTKLMEVLLNAKIDNGLISKRWWMYCKLGSSFSLRMLLDDAG